MHTLKISDLLSNKKSIKVFSSFFVFDEDNFGGNVPDGWTGDSLMECYLEDSRAKAKEKAVEVGRNIRLEKHF